MEGRGNPPSFFVLFLGLSHHIIGLAKID